MTFPFSVNPPQRIDRFDLPVVLWRWPFAEERRSEIDAHFAELCRHKPLWNGRVLLARNRRMDGRVWNAEYFETDFASFLCWRDWGYPDLGVFNGYGMGAMRSTDGAFLLGEMAQHTANAGSVYFPCGTPDPDDLRDNSLDLAGSAVREVAEETGLCAEDYIPQDGWTVVEAPAQVALIRVLQMKDDALILKRRIEAFLARDKQSELSAIHVVRRLADCPDRVTPHVRAFLAQALPG